MKKKSCTHVPEYFCVLYFSSLGYLREESLWGIWFFSQFVSNLAILSRVTLTFVGWPSTSMGQLFYIKLCVSFQSHRWIQPGVTVRKCPIWVKIFDSFVPYDLEIWRMTLKNCRAPSYATSSYCTPPLCHIKSFASFHHHMWIHTGITVGKR